MQGIRDVTEANPQEHATEGEVIEAVEKLSDTDMIRLEKIARTHLWVAQDADIKDLIQEALKRILSGKRKWPLHVPFMKFISGVMRSIAFDILKQMKTEQGLRVVQATNCDGQDSSKDYMEYEDKSSTTPEESLIFKQKLDEIENMFIDDEKALAVVMGKSEGFSPKETQEMFDLTETEYESAARKVRRRFSDYLNENKNNE